MHNETLLFVAFNIFVIVLLMVDLKVFHRRAHQVSIREALLWSVVWIVLSLLFNAVVYFWYGHEAALQFFTGYLIEKSLSVDNLFVFLVIFSYFKVPAHYQHTVLYWGILGALVMRGLLIVLGVTIINEFHWVIYLLGAFLVFTGVRMAIQKEELDVQPERNIVVRIFKRFIPVTAGYHDTKFIVQVDGRRVATLLLVVLIVVETTDLLFAVDSIPAIFAISTDPFIVYTSNVFAILGLRALYFALAGMMHLFRFLKIGLSIVLTFVGLKMIFDSIFPIAIGVSLAIVATVLAMSVIFSILIKPTESRL
jgi:tellurite resistance protein TerC